ncbi:MAG TPA: hypothetical protein VNO30_36455 [Kofleriaceae bacterium]|nr:hypothetical protein [Kofleriaceae bacterium]
MKTHRSHVFAACFWLAGATVALPTSGCVDSTAPPPEGDLGEVSQAVTSTTCTGTSHVTYTPGLTLTRQSVSVTETDIYSSCTSTDSTLTSGSLGTFTFTLPNAACNDLQTFGPGDITIFWNNNQSSTATLSFEVTVTGGILQEVGTGTITAGEFTGATATLSWVYAVVNPLLCLVPGGLTTQDGIITAQITGL